jgi:predicted permease
LLVVVQVALSLVLLVGTGMLVRSIRELETADIGAARESLVLASVDAQRGGYEGPRLNALIRDLTERVGRIPGVVASTASENGLFNGTESGSSIHVEGFAARTEEDTVVAYDDVLPGYFHTIGARMLQGRDFEARDNESGPKVAIVNQTMAQFYWPRSSALGRQITMDSVTYEIVGVASDVEEQSLRNARERRMYLAMLQLGGDVPREFRIEARASGDPVLLVDPIRRALSAAAAELVITDVSTLAERTRDSISQDILVSRVVSFFGLLTLGLAALGLYGVMAHAAARRTTEFGLRMALGAQPGALTRMMLRESMLTVLAGVGLGLPAALFAMKLIRALLYAVPAVDPPSLLFAAGVLFLSALVAGYLPARRAARVAPLEAIRAD